MKRKSKKSRSTSKLQPVSTPSGRISFVADPAALLTYELGIDPSPLTVSLPDANPVLAALTFVITNQQSDPVEVASIGFTIQLGGDGAALAASSAGIQTAPADTTNWKVTASSSDDTAIYTLGPQTGSTVTLASGDSVVLQIYNIATNYAPGVTTIEIKEMAVGSQPAFPEFNVTKFPYGFYFDGLVATVESGSVQVPVAQVGYNSSVTLLWNSSVTDVTAFQVFYATNQGQQPTPPVTTAGRWDSPPLTRDTVFTVVVTSTTIGGQPVSASMSIPVAVQQPDVVANTLSVAGAATAANLTVQGASALQGAVVIGTSSVGAPLTVNGGIAATGVVNAGGGLNVTGATTLANASVNGPLAATGTIAMLTAARSIAPGQFTATTDGFVLGYVSAPDDSVRKNFCWTTIGAASGSVTVQAVGGNVANLDNSGNTYSAPNFGSFLLPVSSGQAFSLGVFNDPANQSNATTAFFWIPLGTPTGQTLRKIPAAQRAARFLAVKRKKGQPSIIAARRAESRQEKKSKPARKSPSAAKSKQRQTAPHGPTNKTKRAPRRR